MKGVFGSLLLLLLSARCALAAPYVLSWLCLERCGDNAAQIASQLESLSVNSTIFSAASFEDYNLGANSTLVKNDLTQVAGPIRQLGLETWAMVSSYPYPPEFLSWMRQVFADPEPFIDACLRAAAEEHLTGFNIDWEPTSAENVTAADASAYAAFVQHFSQAMHAQGVKVSVDVATWSPIWDLPALAATDVDYLVTMGTYTANTTSFLHQLDKALASVPVSKLVVGLECDEKDVGVLSQEALAERFAALKERGVGALGLWRMPVPDAWWPFLADFAAGK